MINYIKYLLRFWFCRKGKGKIKAKFGESGKGRLQLAARRGGGRRAHGANREPQPEPRM